MQDFNFNREPSRDPLRIEPMAERFEQLLLIYWKKHPDTRLGQILTQFQFYMQGQGYKDLFYIEDDVLLEHWEKFVNR